MNTRLPVFDIDSLRFMSTLFGLGQLIEVQVGHRAIKVGVDVAKGVPSKSRFCKIQYLAPIAGVRIELVKTEVGRQIGWIGYVRAAAGFMGFGILLPG